MSDQTATPSPSQPSREAILREDRQLSAEQLDAKYNLDGDGRHPIFGEQAWMQEVMDRFSLRGYWDWVVSQIEEEID